MVTNAFAKNWECSPFQDDVLIEGTATGPSQKATLEITQPDANAIYVNDGGMPPDAIPLLIEAGEEFGEKINPILVIRNWGDEKATYDADGILNNKPRESELRFDVGKWTTAGEYPFANAAIYTWSNDRTLRLRPFMAYSDGTPYSADNGFTEMRIRNVDNDIFAQLVSYWDNEASIEFITPDGTGDKRDITRSNTSSKIYRPAGSDDLRFAVVDGSDVLQDRMIIGSDGTLSVDERVSIGIEDGAYSGFIPLRVHSTSPYSYLRITNVYSTTDFNGGLMIGVAGSSDAIAEISSEPGMPISIVPGAHTYPDTAVDSGVVIGKSGYGYDEPYMLYVEGDVNVNGGLRLNTTNTRPLCNSDTPETRGMFWFTEDDFSGDTLEICTFNGSDYSWRAVSLN